MNLLTQTKLLETMNDDNLLNELMDWIRIYRNEGNLFGDERVYFKLLIAEVFNRKLLSKQQLYGGF